MAANTKRIPIKWIRDGAKSAYSKQTCCFICDSEQDLELHHLNGMTNLLETWAKREGIALNTDEQVLEIRERFIEEHRKEIYEQVYTLCASHHKKLHGIFGKSPPLRSAAKQEIWIIKQKDKHNEIERPESSELVPERQSRPISNSTGRGIFGRFINDSVSFSSLRSN